MTDKELMEAQIRATEANTRAMEAYTAALREHTAALNNQAEETKKARRFLERITENYKNGSHTSVTEALDTLGRIVKMFGESSDKVDSAAKRIANSMDNFRR